MWLHSAVISKDQLVLLKWNPLMSIEKFISNTSLIKLYEQHVKHLNIREKYQLTSNKIMPDLIPLLTIQISSNEFWASHIIWSCFVIPQTHHTLRYWILNSLDHSIDYKARLIRDRRFMWSRNDNIWFIFIRKALWLFYTVSICSRIHNEVSRK